jgi:hypothetical protein
MKVLQVLLASCALLSTSCGLFSRPQYATAPLQTQRYDAASRSWVPVNTPIVRPASRPTYSLPPEKSAETAKVLQTTSPTPAPKPGEVVDTSSASQEQPGLMKRVGRAATSPLRLIGIGKDENS